jgi:hypothetical protein
VSRDAAPGPVQDVAVTDAPAPLMQPALELAFEVRVDVAPPLRVGGHGPHDVLSFVAITGGTVAGPRLNGVVLPGGGDWYTDRDGVITLDARYLLRADDGAVIDVANRGFWRADPDTTARLDAGEQVDEADYYYRTSPVFTTDAEPHAWLTRTVFVGLAREERGRVCIRFFSLA